MHRRATPDPTAKAVGQRIRQLRGERGLTAERLAFESELGSKGFLSDIEKGRASPSLRTLRVIAEYLEVLLVDLFTFPDHDERQQLIDRTRWLAPGHYPQADPRHAARTERRARSRKGRGLRWRARAAQARGR